MIDAYVIKRKSADLYFALTVGPNHPLGPLNEACLYSSRDAAESDHDPRVDVVIPVVVMIKQEWDDCESGKRYVAYGKRSDKPLFSKRTKRLKQKKADTKPMAPIKTVEEVLEARRKKG